MTSTTALVVSGGGRFTDPWHPFAETSSALAGVLRERGYAVQISDDPDAGLASLHADTEPSLLVMNIGWHGPDRFDEPATEGLLTALDAGVPTLLVHSTLTAFPEWPLWRDIAGGGWTLGTTYHPDYGLGVALADPDHPVTDGLGEVAITDERYTRMWVAGSSSVFLEHVEGGERHPLAWTRTWGAALVVADALGHDAASYRTSGRLALLHRELDWLERQQPGAAPST